MTKAKIASMSVLGAAMATTAGAQAVDSELDVAEHLALSTSNHEGTTLSFEGGLLFTGFTQHMFDPKEGNAISLSEEKLGEFDDDMGYYGRISLSRTINSNWDWRLSGSALGTLENNASIFEEGPELSVVGTAGTLSSAQMIDFNLGQTFQNGNNSTRLGFGAGALNLSQTAEKGLIYTDNEGPESYGFNIDGTIRFAGFGPRVSLDFETPTGSGNSSVIAGAEAGYYFGRRNATASITGFSDIEGAFDYEFEETENMEMLALSLMIGMAFDVSDDTRLTAGVRTHHFATSNDDEEYMLDDPYDTVSAFVGVDMKF